uniref:Uncharacterized protein n=1 Tax=Falco tinnunculus TaxID=100819 RepID=A0A8C4V7W7_FALTI
NKIKHFESQEQRSFSQESKLESYFIKLQPVFAPHTNQHYAGAKFSDQPSPSMLPKPISLWVPVSFKPSDKEIMTFQHTTFLIVQD